MPTTTPGALDSAKAFVNAASIAARFAAGNNSLSAPCAAPCVAQATRRGRNEPRRARMDETCDACNKILLGGSGTGAGRAGRSLTCMAHRTLSH